MASWQPESDEAPMDWAGAGAGEGCRVVLDLFHCRMHLPPFGGLVSCRYFLVVHMFVFHSVFCIVRQFMSMVQNKNAPKC